jgi:hypothetical protein
MRFWRTRRERTRSIHGHARFRSVQIGFHAHLHGYPAGDYRFVFQPQFTIDLGRK